METIIRAAAVAATTRQLRRPLTRVGDGDLPQDKRVDQQPEKDKRDQHGAKGQPSAAPAKPDSKAHNPSGAATVKLPHHAEPDPRQAAQAASDQQYSAALARLAQEQEQQQSAQNMILQKQREAELVQAKQAAEKLGYSEGLARGEQAGLEQMQKKLQQQLQDQLTTQGKQLQEILQQLQDARQTVIDGAQDIMVEIVYEALTRIVGEIFDQRSTVLASVKQVLQHFRQHQPLVMMLHPQDLAVVQQSLTELGIDPEQTQLRADPSLKMGGCIVESAVGTLDARLETQLSRLRDTLLLVRRGEEYPGELG